MRLSPDELVFWRYGYFVLNSTIVTTWALMLVMTVGAMLITRRLATEGPRGRENEAAPKSGTRMNVGPVLWPLWCARRALKGPDRDRG